jgi:hypothetical protein
MTHRILSWSLVAILGLATLGCGNTGDAKKESQPAVTPPAATDAGSGTKAPAEPQPTGGSGTTGSGSR